MWVVGHLGFDIPCKAEKITMNIKPVPKAPTKRVRSCIFETLRLSGYGVCDDDVGKVAGSTTLKPSESQLLVVFVGVRLTGL